MPANLLTMAIIASVIEYGCELQHPAGEIYGFKVGMWHKEDKEVTVTGSTTRFLTLLR